MKNRAQGGIGGSTDVSVEATPLPPRRDIIKTINFTAPVNISGTLVIHLLLYFLLAYNVAHNVHKNYNYKLFADGKRFATVIKSHCSNVNCGTS